MSLRIACLMTLFMTVADDTLAEVTYFRKSGGVTREAESLPTNFTSSNLLRWRQPLESGHSSPCVTEKFVILTTFDDKKLSTVVLDRKSGQLMWKRVAPADRIEPVHRVGSPASATVATDGEQVYVFFGSYGLLCYDFKGELVWQKPLGPFQDEFGAPSSPILVDGKLIINQDHDVDSFLMALNAKTGRELWTTMRPDAVRSYATPIICQGAAGKEILVAGALRLTAYDFESGKPLWWIDGLARIVNTTPVLGKEGTLFVASWSPGGDAGQRISMESWEAAKNAYDNNNDDSISLDELPPGGPVSKRFFRVDLNQDGGLVQHEWERHARVFELAENGVVAVRPGGEGNLTNTNILWRYRKGIPYVPSPLIYNDVVFMVKNGGILTTLDANSGEVIRQARLRDLGNYYASPIAAAGHVYLASERGIVTVVTARGDWEIVSSHDFGEQIMATPAIRGNEIFIRTEETLYCFGK